VNAGTEGAATRTGVARASANHGWYDRATVAWRPSHRANRAASLVGGDYVKLDSETASRIRAAFPGQLSDDVDAVLETLTRSEHAPTDSDIGPITVCGERLHIPMRVYFGVPAASDREGLTGVQREVFACLFTRHHDGRIREEACAQAIVSTADWAPVFVVQLIGEYVIEIIQLIERHAELLARPAYQRFVFENPEFMKLTRSRATSYWDCYFRNRWVKEASYPGHRLLDLLEEDADPEV
jgi:hypothetical protein